MRLEWSGLAVWDRDGIFDHVAASNPRAAIALDETIERRVSLLAEHPQIGRPGRVEGTRESVISGTAYIAAYRVMGDTVRILRVLHGARRWPRDL